MTDHATSLASFDEWLPDQLLSAQRDASGILDDHNKLPLSLPGELQPSSEMPRQLPSLPENFSSMTKKIAGKIGSSSLFSDKFHPDSGHFSDNEERLAVSSSDRHQHWCFICENPRPILTCDGWKRHMREHETKYPCLACKSQKDPSHADVPMFTRKVNLVDHLERHINLHETVDVDCWRQTQKIKFYSCGFCTCLFERLIEYLNHIDGQHFKHHETIQQWDTDKVILGLLRQPLVEDAWRRTLVSYSISERQSFTWDLDATRDLQHRLEISEESPEVLATSALMASTYGSRQNVLRPPKPSNYSTVQDKGLEPGFLALSLVKSPKIFHERTCPSVRQQRSCDLLEFGADVPPCFCPNLRRLQDGSGQDPWDPLRIYEGETLSIMNHNPRLASSSEKKQSTNHYCSTAANEVRDFADGQEVGSTLGTALIMDSAYRSFLLPTNSSPLNNPIISAIHPLNALDQSAGHIINSYNQESSSERSITSMRERKESDSTGEEKENTKLAQRMQECRDCQERNLSVSPRTET